MAESDSDFNEAYAFDVYNPHPYRGGYDIALTYGHPLPPSPAICYPLSDPTIAPTPPEPPHRPESDLGYGHHPDPYPDPYPSDPSGFFSDPDGEARPRGGSGCWRRLRRAADYLFGHSQGYGERRIGVDSYGIPIYALKANPADDRSLVVQVEPATEHRAYPAHSQDFSWCYSESRDGSCNASYVDPIETTWYHQPSYDEAYEDPSLKWYSSSNDERKYETLFFGAPGHAYNRHSYEEPVHVQVEPIEQYSFQKPSYSDEYAYTTSNLCSSYDERKDETHFFGTSNYAHYYEEPLNVQVEPSQQTSFQKPSYHEAYQEDAPTMTNLHALSFGESLEPFEPTWFRNPSYYEVYGEEASPMSKRELRYPEMYEEPSHTSNSFFSLYGAQVNGCDASRNLDYVDEIHYCESPLSVQLDPYKPTWSQNPISCEIYKDELSLKSNQDDYSYEENVTRFFWPFHN